jgi:hypothetical protein
MKGSRLSLTPFFSLRRPAISRLISRETGDSLAGIERTKGYSKKSTGDFASYEPFGPELTAERLFKVCQLPGKNDFYPTTGLVNLKLFSG